MSSLIDLILKYQGSKDIAEKERLMFEFVDEIGPDLSRFIYSRCRSPDAEDAFQETLIAVAMGLEQFPCAVDANVYGWAYGIARHKICDQARGRQMRLATIVDTELLRDSVRAAHAETPITGSERADLDDAINLLKVTSPPCLQLLWNRYVVGLSFVQIGREHAIKEEAARKRVERCLKLAQELVGE